MAECLDDMTIAAMLDGALTPAERASIEAHLESCAECYEVLASAARFLAEEEFSLDPRPAPRRPASSRRVIALTAAVVLAVAVLLLFVATR